MGIPSATMKLTYRLRQVILICGDIASYYIGFALALFARSLTLPYGPRIIEHISLFSGLFVLWIIANYVNGLYDLRLMTLVGNNRRIAESGFIAVIIGMIFFYLMPTASVAPKTILALTVLFGFGLSGALRSLYLTYIGTQTLTTRILFLGVTDEIKELTTILSDQTNLGYHISTIIDPDNLIDKQFRHDIDIYHSLNTLRPAIDTKQIHTVVVAPYMNEREEVKRELYELLFWPVQIIDLTSFYEAVTGRIPPSTFSESWFLKNLRTMDRPVYTKAKRGIDIVVGFLLIAVLACLTPLIALGTKWSSPGPIFFKQKRVGMGGKIFWIYKFRTMYALAKDGSAETNGAQFATKDDIRITPIGRLLRKTRIDELPQAINLITGEVTLIGPRPERPEIVEDLKKQMPYYPLRHIIKPGITGWAAIHQHYTDTLESSLQKLQYDLYYIKNRSLILDVAIVLKTINVVVRGKGQ